MQALRSNSKIFRTHSIIVEYSLKDQLQLSQAEMQDSVEQMTLMGVTYW